jgi:hypothetical protein
MSKIIELPEIEAGDKTVLRVWSNHGDHPQVARFSEELAQQRKCPDCGTDMYLVMGSGQVYPTHGILSTGQLVCPGDVLITKE